MALVSYRPNLLEFFPGWSVILCTIPIINHRIVGPNETLRLGLFRWHDRYAALPH